MPKVWDLDPLRLIVFVIPRCNVQMHVPMIVVVAACLSPPACNLTLELHHDPVGHTALQREPHPNTITVGDVDDKLSLVRHA